MFGDPIMSLHQPGLLVIALALSALAIILALARRPAAPKLTMLLCALGLLLLSLAAGAPDWHFRPKQTVAVMVDLSPSTRVADYRDPMMLNRRIHDLLSDVPYQITYFSDKTADTAPSASRLQDMPADHTVFDPPAAAAMLLFSDCRFDLPSQCAPTYIVVDPALEDLDDAAVTRLELNGNDAQISIRAAGTRQLSLSGTSRIGPTTVPAGSYVITGTRDSKASRISAELSAGDAWPENDSLSLIPPAPREFERWWIGNAQTSDGSQTIPAEQLPTDPVAYLSASLIVLDNISAAQLTEIQQQRLSQYVRNVGGGLLILGGDHSFAAGAYEGTALDAMSPLACDPPEPTTHWVLLADSSGSMSAPAAGSTRWAAAVASLVSLLPHLPPGDLLSAGSFSDQTTWWIESKPAGEAIAQPLPPPGVFPHGPTNLEPALHGIADSADGHMPIQVLVLSDFEAQISDPKNLVRLLRSKRVRLHVLAIGEGSALPAMRQMAAATGGAAITQLDPTRWAESARELMQAASNSRIQRDSVQVDFQDDASAAPAQRAPVWNRAWIKNGALRLAHTPQSNQMIPMAAMWNVGEGRCAAATFAPGPAQLRILADLAARSPRDPRFSVTCDADQHLHVRVDGTDQGQFLNDQSLSLELQDFTAGGAQVTSIAIPQTAPGRYELTLPAPRSPALAKVRAAGKTIWQGAIAGRYAHEFDALGNDHAAMNELATRSGGGVITPDQTAPLRILWPFTTLPLTSWLAALGAVFIALGLIWWRIN